MESNQEPGDEASESKEDSDSKELSRKALENAKKLPKTGRLRAKKDAPLPDLDDPDGLGANSPGTLEDRVSARSSGVRVSDHRASIEDLTVTSSGSLDEAEAKKAVEKAKRFFEACVSPSRLSNASDDSEEFAFSIELNVADDGQVSGVDNLKSDLPTDVTTCVARQLKSPTYPRPEAHNEIVYVSFRVELSPFQAR